MPPLFAQTESADSSFLWKISYEGEEVGALLGTVHIGTKEGDVPEAAKLLLDQSSHLVTEVQVLFPSPQDERRIYSQAIFSAFKPSAETIDERFSDQYAERVRDALRKQRIIMLNQQDLLSSELILMMMMFDIGQGYQADYGMEKLLRNYVADQSIENMPLEEIVESLEYYIEASQPLTKMMIEAWLDHQELLQSMNQQLIQAYEENDIKKFVALMTEMESISLPYDEYKAEIENYYDLLIFNRNHQWIEKLAPILKENVGTDEKHFIAVGAFHLLSEEGVVELLRQEGFEVMPVGY